jgi:hypothetical protein
MRCLGAFGSNAFARIGSPCSLDTRTASFYLAFYTAKTRAWARSKCKIKRPAARGGVKKTK